MRLVTGLKQRFELTLLLRPAFGPRTINWKDEGSELAHIVEGPAGRVAFAAWVVGAWLLCHRTDFVARNGRRMVRGRFEASRCFDDFAGLVEEELTS